MFAFFAGVTVALAAAGSAPDEPAAVMIDNVQVFDGETSVGTRDVLLRAGRIAAVRKHIEAPADAVVIEGRGRTLLPGLLDSHVHVFPSAPQDALRFGVTAEFDMFTIATPEQVRARQAQRESYARVDGADVWSAGSGVTPPGGHPQPMARSMGVEIPTLAADADAAEFVRARVAEGSDHIKIFQDDGAANGGPPRLTAFPRERLKTVIGAARSSGRKAIVHVGKLADAKDAFAFGADAIAHMVEDRPADQELVELIKARNGAVIATLSVIAGVAAEPFAERLVADPTIAPHLSPMQKGMIAQRFTKTDPGALKTALESVGRLHAAGVPVLAGTDAPNPTTAHGPTLHQELELLVEAGLSPAEALAAATSKPADFFGVADRGRVREGLRADLLLVEGDPTADIRASRRIVAIWKNGFPVDRSKMPAPPSVPGR